MGCKKKSPGLLRGCLRDDVVFCFYLQRFHIPSKSVFKRKIFSTMNTQYIVFVWLIIHIDHNWAFFPVESAGEVAYNI